MMRAYHNMSCPPKSTVQKIITPVGKQILFSFKLAHLPIPNDPNEPEATRDASIQTWLADYILQHKAELDDITRPMAYMIGCLCENAQMTPKQLEQKYPKCHCCCDPMLTLAILGRMSGNLYVPQREIRLTCHSLGFSETISFPAKDFHI